MSYSLRSVVSALRCLCAPLSLRSVVSALRCLCAPLSLRSVVPLLMASLSLFAISASAQTHGAFQATYSGGSVTGKVLAANGGPATCSNTPQVSPFTSSGGQYAGSATVSASTDSGGGTNQCSANIPDPNGSVPSALTATLTWQTDPANPGELPPSCAIVTQTDDASWTMSADSSSPGSGTVSNGLGGTVVPNPGGAGAVCNSTAYSVWTASGSPAPSSFPETCSPTVSFSGTSGPGYSHAGLSGSVSAAYRVSASPVFINIGGTYNPSANDYHVLTGQQITASLSGIPSGFTVTKYTWNQPSATCFKTYNEKATSNPLVALGTSDLSGPAAGSTSVAPLAFYDSAAENVTVTCTVSINAPDGTALSVTATSPTINVLKPTVTTWGINTGTDVQNGISTGLGVSHQSGLITALEIWGGITINEPKLGTTTVGGQGCIAQIITADADTATGTTTGGTGVTWIDVVKNANGKFVASQTPALDTGLPFPFGYKLGANGVMNTVTNTGSSAFSVSQSGYSGDAPDLSMFPGGGINWTNVFFSSTYNTYVMYQPPGGVWVPLQMITWSYALTAKPTPGGPYTNPADQSQWAVFTPTFSGGIPSNTNTPPTWGAVEASPLYFGPVSP